jgi:Tfp pilus assembly protein PilF
MAYLKAGKTDQAREALTKAVSSGRPFPGSEEAKAALAQLPTR